MELRRVELLSEGLSPELSPSAVSDLTFPQRTAHRQAERISSFMLRDLRQSLGKLVPCGNDAGNRPRRQVGPTRRLIRQRLQNKIRQLHLFPRFYRGLGPRLAYPVSNTPVETGSAPCHLTHSAHHFYLLFSRNARRISRSASRLAMVSRLSCSALPLHNPSCIFIRPSFR